MVNDKGFTLIELLAVIVILAIIALIATPLILNVIDKAKKGAFKDSAYGIIKSAELSYAQSVMKGQLGTITYSYVNGTETSEPSGYILAYKGDKPKNGTVIVNEEGKVAIAIHNGNYCAEKGYDTSDVVLSDKKVEECNINTGNQPVYTDYNPTEGVNAPKLTTGMTPVKWDGSKWVDTTEDDPNWYDYSNNQWANARTADNSLWVWIPRYIYKISGNVWHVGNVTSSVMVSVQFSIDTDDTRGGSVTIDTGTTAEASNNKWTNHPAFTFGDTELTGFWVGKYEPSGNSTTVYIRPNSTAMRNLTIEGMFNVARNMETDNQYGWDISGDGIDTHMAKNTEWGAVAYLSKSISYSLVWINPSSSYTTGCAGSTSTANNTSGCPYTYDTTNGQNASTTGNIYGVYDMSGSAYENTASYVNNGSCIPSYLGDLLNADAKYKDIYSVGTSDTSELNYANTINVKGDAIYETSSSYTSNTAWQSDNSRMPHGSSCTFIRGGNYSGANTSGLFAFGNLNGGSNTYTTFRPILLVAPGL